MEVVIAIAACALLAVQTHRNYLMVQTGKRTQQPPRIEQSITVEVDYDSLASAMEKSWPAVTVSTDFEINYDKLSAAIKKALIESEVAVHNAAVSAPIPVVTYTTPERAIAIPVEPVTEEVNGVPVRRFPSR